MLRPSTLTCTSFHALLEDWYDSALLGGRRGGAVRCTERRRCGVRSDGINNEAWTGSRTLYSQTIPLFMASDGLRYMPTTLQRTVTSSRLGHVLRQSTYACKPREYRGPTSHCRKNHLPRQQPDSATALNKITTQATTRDHEGPNNTNKLSLPTYKNVGNNETKRGVPPQHPPPRPHTPRHPSRRAPLGGTRQACAHLGPRPNTTGSDGSGPRTVDPLAMENSENVRTRQQGKG